MAAIFAARAGQSVVVVDTRPKPGAKIRVSGGGRCNVLPSEVTPGDFHTQGSRNTLRNILLSWPLEAVRAFFEDDLGIPLKIEPSGKLFPRSDQSRDVIDAMLEALRLSGAVLRAPFRVEQIERDISGGFRLISADGESLDCRRLVLATGGLSLPKSGSDGTGLALARVLGHGLVPTYPALVPLLSGDTACSSLAGVSVRVRVTVERGARKIDEAEGDFLFTHRGFSGPVILDTSHHVTRDGDIRLRVHWGGAGVDDWDAVLREGGSATVTSTISRHLPKRLAAVLIERSAVDPSVRISELRRSSRKRLVDVLSRFDLPVTGNEGYATAEVTGGGIPLSEVTPGTLESRIVPGLYLCGEILDATGRLGGYNFLWAWVTGRKAGLAAAGNK
jgi:predicted Rossmann fold flavoprotein